MPTHRTGSFTQCLGVLLGPCLYWHRNGRHQALRGPLRRGPIQKGECLTLTRGWLCLNVLVSRSRSLALLAQTPTNSLEWKRVLALPPFLLPACLPHMCIVDRVQRTQYFGPSGARSICQSTWAQCRGAWLGTSSCRG
jgi:hypothetical protein